MPEDPTPRKNAKDTENLLLESTTSTSKAVSFVCYAFAQPGRSPANKGIGALSLRHLVSVCSATGKLQLNIRRLDDLVFRPVAVTPNGLLSEEHVWGNGVRCHAVRALWDAACEFGPQMDLFLVMYSNFAN